MEFVGRRDDSEGVARVLVVEEAERKNVANDEALHKAERVPTRRILLVKLALLHLLHTVHRRLLPVISIKYTDRDSGAAQTKLSTAVGTTCCMNMCDMHDERHYF